MSNNPTFKTGIKTLTDVQLRNGLPSYDILMDKIRTIRENAQAVSNVPIDGSFENLKYDNILSILGGRGAGKTSILLTIYSKLRNDAKNINIMMPLIMPELIDNGDSFIGWILSAVEKELQAIENKIKEKGYRKDNGTYAHMCDEYHFFERCTFNNNNTLRSTFSELKKSYYAKVYNARRGEWDINSDMALVSSINDRGFSLIEQFTRFWNQLVYTYQEFYRTNNEDKRTPLIFFMIDDADLKPQIINELIFSLPKYFSHPNVVVLISASQKTLNYTVKNFMYQQITNREFNLMELLNIEYKYNSDIYTHHRSSLPLVKFHELRYGKEYDKITTLTEEILRKLFPVSNRFYLKKYDLYADKCSLKFENSDHEILNISKQFAKELNAFKEEVIALHKSKFSKTTSHVETYQENKLARKEQSFTLTNSNDMKDEVYLAFLSKYPRDIVSGYYSFHDMIKELLSLLKSFYETNADYSFGADVSDELLKGIHDSCTSFINSILLSNPNLKLFSKNYNEFVLERRLHWQLFVNYSLVFKMMREAEHIDKNQTNPTPFIEMIFLLNFVEQLIVLVIPRRELHHGYKELQDILDICCIDIVKKSNDIYQMFKQYEIYDMYKVIPQFDCQNHEHQDVLLDVVARFGLIDENTNDIILNQDWYDMVSKVLFYRFSNIELMRQHRNIIFLLKSKPFVDTNYMLLCDHYYDLVKTMIYENRNINNDIAYALKELTTNVQFATDTIEQMETKMLSLQNVMDDLSLKFKHPNDIENLASFGDEIDDIRGASMLRKVFRNLWSMLDAHDGTINYSHLTSCLDTIQHQLPDNFKTVSYASWFRRLNRFLEGSLTTIHDKNYDKYECLCGEINRSIEKYVESVLYMYFKPEIAPSRFENVEKMKNYYQELKDDTYIKQQINVIQEREWNNLIEGD